MRKSVWTWGVFCVFVWISTCAAQTSDVFVVTDQIPPEEQRPAGYTFVLGSEAAPYGIGSGSYLGNIYLGYYGPGAYGTNGYAVQNGGAVSTPNLYIGERGVSAYNKRKGQYTINAGTLDFSNLFLGHAAYYCSGSFYQNGGTVTGGTEYIGYDSSGSYTQTAGVNDVSTMYLGYDNSGYYTIEGTGELNASTLILGQSSGGVSGSGTLNIHGGTVNAGTVHVNRGGFDITTKPAIDVQSDLVSGGFLGGASVSGWENTTLTVDQCSTFSHTGDFTVKSLLFGGDVDVAYNLDGTLNLKSYLFGWNYEDSGTTGTLNINGTLNLDSGAMVDFDVVNINSAVTADMYNMIDAEKVTVNAPTVISNYSSLYVFDTMPDAKLTVNSNLTIDSSDLYSFNDSDINSGQLTVQNGAYGYLYNDADVNDATINLESDSYMYVGQLYAGKEDESDSVINISGDSQLYAQSWAGTTGEAHLGMGENSTAELNQTGTSSKTSIDGDFFIGSGATSTGTFNLNQGSLIAESDMYIGYQGTGTLTQTDSDSSVEVGTNVRTPQSLYIGSQTGSSGEYIMNGGTLDVTGDLYVGKDGTGRMEQHGNAHVKVYGEEYDPVEMAYVPVARDVNIATGTNSTGTYILNSTQPNYQPSLEVSGDLNIGTGDGAVGYAEIQSSYAKIAGTVNIGTEENSDGKLVMKNNSQLTADKIHIGDLGNGYAGNQGHLDMTSDTAHLTVTDEIIFGRNAKFEANEKTTVGQFPEINHIHLKGDSEKGAGMKIIYDQAYQPAGYDTAALSGLENLTVLITGGSDLNPCTIEAPGVNQGPIVPVGGWGGGGWADGNYSFDKLYLGSFSQGTSFRLYDSSDNQQSTSQGHEALYVNDLFISPFTFASDIIAGEFVGRHIEFDSTNGDPEDSINLYWVRLWMWNWDYDPADYDPDNPTFDPWVPVDPDDDDSPWDPWNPTITVIPEPATILLIGLALVALLRKRIK